MARVIEQSDTPGMTTVLTIRTDRGDEFVLDAEACAKAVADLLSDHANERRFGWDLGPKWYEQELRKLRAAAIINPKKTGDDDGLRDPH